MQTDLSPKEICNAVIIHNTRHTQIDVTNIISIFFSILDVTMTRKYIGMQNQAFQQQI